LSKLDSFLAVQSMSGWPTVDRDTLSDHRHSVYWDISDGCLRCQRSVSSKRVIMGKEKLTGEDQHLA
jgi:hypothetical protein